jgi:glycine/D-amino acid oxidase-like deaminating enzyme
MPEFYDEHVTRKIDPMYSEMTLRALSSFVPRLSEYVGVLGGNDIFTDGGYYTYAPDRMPVLGQVSEAPGYFMACGVAGYGIMAALGVAEFICDQKEGKKQTVEYSAFDPDRLFDPIQRERMEQRIQEEAASMEQAVGGSL